MNNEVTCAECQRVVPREETIQHGDSLICAECKPMFMQRLREGVEHDAPYAYAGFWIRVAAIIMDQIMATAVTFPLLFAVYGSGYWDGSEFVAGYLDFFITWILPPFATVAFWVWKQATPAKMILGLRIIDAHTGESPTLRQFIIRYVMYYVCAIPLGVGFICVALDKRKQGWHDQKADTLVIRTRKRARKIFRRKS